MPKPLPQDQPPGRGDAERLKVFISYSRADSRFAAEIQAGLDFDGGFEILIDSHSIHEGEEWKARIAALIAEADAIVVILSPSWVASGICSWELEEAWRHSKRVIPVQPLPLPGATVPARLAAINYVRFDPNVDGTPRLFMEGMSALRRALVTDLGWVREHTRLLSRAAEWDAAGRVENRMLSGNDIAAAKAWLANRPSGAPDPTELHRDYIAACEQAEVLRLSAERQRAETLRKAFVRTRAALVVASIAGLAAGVAGLFAYDKKLDAERSEQAAAAERDAALAVQSRHLTDIAERHLESGDAGTAMLLALAALPDQRPASAAGASGGARPYLPEAEARLYEAYFENHERAVFAGHRGAVLCAVTSADGKLLATGSDDRTLRLWDTGSGRQLMEAKLEDGRITGVAISPDGSLVLAGSGLVARIFESRSGKPVRELKGHGGEILGVAYSGDGARAATVSEDKSVRVWDSSSGGALAVLTGHTGAITSVAMNADGTILVTGSTDARAMLWDVAAKRAKAVVAHKLAVTGVALSADGSTFATSSADKSVRLWSASGKAIGAIEIDAAASGIALDARTQRVIAGFADGSLRVLDLASAKEARRFSGHTAGVTSVHASADGRLVASGSRDGTARLWSMTGTGARAPAGHARAVTAVAIDAGGTLVASASRDGTARLWRAGETKGPTVLGEHRGEVTGIAISRDGSRAVTGSQDTLGRIWDIATAKVAVELKGHTLPVSSVALSADARLAATGSDDLSARIWDAGTGRQLAELKPHAARITSIAFGSKGEQVLTGAGTTARLWNVSSGSQVKVFPPHTGSVLAVALGPDERLAASAGRDAVRVWDVATGRQKHILRGPPGVAATSVGFTQDGARIHSGWSDGRVRIWNASSGAPVAAIRLHEQAISGLALSADGKWMATGASEGSVRVAPLFADTASLVERAIASVPRCLSAEQMKAFHLGDIPPRWCGAGKGEKPGIPGK